MSDYFLKCRFWVWNLGPQVCKIGILLGEPSVQPGNLHPHCPCQCLRTRAAPPFTRVPGDTGKVSHFPRCPGWYWKNGVSKPVCTLTAETTHFFSLFQQTFFGFTHLYVMQVWCLKESEDCIPFSETAVPNGCETPRGARTQVLCESSRCS